MGNGDPVTQQQFYEGQKEILQAVEKVNNTVNGNRISITKIEGKLERVEKLEDQVGSLKTWDRVDSLISSIVAVVLTALGVRES